MQMMSTSKKEGSLCNVYSDPFLVPRVLDMHMLTKRELLWNLRIYH